MREACSARRRHGGFTLIEAAIATVVIGIGIVALLSAMGAGTRVNSQARDITQAVFLAQEIREWTLRLPFSDPDAGDAGNPPGPDGTNPQVFVDDLDDLRNVTYSPPRNAQGLAIAGMAGWSQTITMTWRNPDWLTTTAPVPAKASDGDCICVTVTIRHGQEAVLATSWMVTKRT
jgi:Tfp pilus assembly protein PilV